MNPFERALIELRIERGETVPDKDLVKLDAHDKEVIRLAELLHRHWFETLSTRRCVALVYDIIDNYRPQVEWEDITSDNDNFEAMDKWGRWVTARVRLGGKVHRWTGRIHPHANVDIEDYKRHVRVRLGLALVEAMDNKEAE